MKFLYRTGDYAFIISAMGKLFVMVFADAAPMTNSLWFLHPDTSLRYHLRYLLRYLLR
jgi:hypothetical protein